MYYRQPRYFNDFHCIGSECANNCCFGWRIDWKAEEIEKAKCAPNCSAELKELIEKSFIPNEALEGQFAIEFDDHGECPCATEDGLCRIQKELGAEYLSTTCTVYPRRYIVANPVLYRFCNSTCHVVTDKLLNDAKAMDLVNILSKEDEIYLKTNYTMDSEAVVASFPHTKYRGELLEFFYEVIADKKHDVETNIILGALAAQALTKLVEQGESDKIPDTLKSLRAQMHNGAHLKTIENIKPNYHLRFGFIGKILTESVGLSLVEFLNDKTGTPNIAFYEAAHKRLQEIFKDRPFYLRNIALNLLLELKVPLQFREKTIFENYSLFAASFACVKLNMISIALKDDLEVNFKKRIVKCSGDDRFSMLTAIFCRSISQSELKQHFILDFLREHGFTSPAYLALLVK